MDYKLDVQKIADELDFDLEDVEMLLEVFLDSTKEILESLKDAVDTNNFKDIYLYAHAIKGSASNLTLNEISDTAKEMENNARESNSIDYKERYTKLENLIQSIKEN